MGENVDVDDETVIGDWVKTKNLGVGGFGKVTLWENSKENLTIAIKTCRKGTGTLISKKQRDRWTKEVEIMQKLSHPNLVKALPIPEELSHLTSELPILCMEFCTGGDLRKELLKPENCCGLPEQEIRNIIHDVIGAVQYLHSHKIIHRDLKPENIVLQQLPNLTIVYKLIDLGYAKEVDQNSLCFSLVGTFQYLAPELFTKEYTCSVDYWSLGLVCHEIITGFRPFLPHMSSLTWMDIVKKKSSNDICIYENADGNVVFSEEIFPENHISQPFRYDIERWLCMALEWDGSKRGKSFDNNLVIFSNLEHILKKKIISVYSTVAFQKFGYEIDDSTLLGTLKLWVQRDTKQSVDSQLVLLPSGEELPDTALVHHHWTIENQVAMLYVFPKEGFQLPSITPKAPMLVSKILEAPREKLPYHIVKRAWANAVYYMQQIYTSYEILLEAYAVKMLSIISNHQLITSWEQETRNELQKVFSKYKLSKDSVQYDVKCFREIGQDNTLNNKWNDVMKYMDEKIAHLSEVSKRLSGTIASATKKVAILQNYEEPGQLYIEQLNSLLNSGYKVYGRMRRKPEQEREESFDSVDMVKVIFLCMKLCSKMLKDQEFITHLNDLLDCEQCLCRLIPPLKSFKLQIGRFKQEIIKQQLLRQKDIWEIIFNLKQIPVNSTALSNEHIINSSKNKDERNSTECGFQINNFFISQVKSHHETSHISNVYPNENNSQETESFFLSSGPQEHLFKRLQQLGLDVDNPGISHFE